jgi:hypothetical protein
MKWSGSLRSRGAKSSEDIGLSLPVSGSILEIALSYHVLPFDMLPTRLLRVVGVAFATVLVACGDPTTPTATAANLSLSFSVFALTGTNPAVPNAINFFAGPRRADATFDFDVAVDLDATGKVVLYPVRAMAGAIVQSTPSRVGLQSVSGTFESVREAPETGYDTITVRTISPGTVVAVQIVDQLTGLCTFSVNGQFNYAKFVVDSVNMTTRQLFIRSVTDANCGFRSLVPDSIPTF